MTMKYVALGEFIPYEGIQNWVKDTFGQLPMNQEAIEEIAATGAQTDSFLQNMDSMLLIVLAILIVCIALALFSCCIYFDYRIFRTYMLLRNAVFWNVFIRYTLQSYLKMSFTVLA